MMSMNGVYEHQTKEIYERPFYSYQNSLNLVFLLLNDKSKFSKIFWHSSRSPIQRLIIFY